MRAVKIAQAVIVSQSLRVRKLMIDDLPRISPSQRSTPPKAYPSEPGAHRDGGFYLNGGA